MRRSLAPSSLVAKKQKIAEGDSPSKENVTENGEIGDLQPLRPLAFSTDYSRRTLSKPFKCPVPGRSGTLSSVGTLGVRKSVAAVGVTFSADDESAVVLHRAYSGFDKQGRRVVDVVVDPIISKFLRPHQIEGVQFLWDCVTGEKNTEEHCGCILADEMGLGKTFQTITLIWTLLRQGKHGVPLVKKFIIIAPASLVKNWSNEILKWLQASRLQLVSLSDTVKEKVLKGIEEFQTRPLCAGLIISYETFRAQSELFIGKRCDLLICDEAHRLKNSEAKQTQAIAALGCKRVVLLSGTPVQNDLEEFFNMIEICNPGMLGTRGEFRKEYENPIMQGRDALATQEDQKKGVDASKKLSDITSRFLMRRTSSILQKYLPPKVELVVFCKLSTLQLALYKQFLASAERKVNKDIENRKTAGALSAITELKKLCNDPSLIHAKSISDNPPVGLEKCAALFPPGYRSDVYHPEHSGKISVLDQMLSNIKAEGQDDAMVLVSNYTQTLDLFEVMCRARKYSYLRLDGTTSTSKRQKLVDQFNNRDNRIFLFLLSSKAGGCGLNIIGANRLVLFDPDWNPATDAQAMGRVWRDGQRKKVYIYRFLATGSLEEKIYQRQITKQSLSSVVIDENSDAERNFSADDMRELFVLEENTNSDTHDRIACSCPTSKRKREVLESMEAEEGMKNMEEIGSWKHCAVPSACKDSVLQKIPSQLVSFVFQNGQ
mmetsp:Transcript_26300/g.43079  ORF Transcript_26300/g.43079 Transcript_26300/m.43079 type:complete len:716 (+) Transcript_26300:238-2385(+)